MSAVKKRLSCIFKLLPGAKYVRKYVCCSLQNYQRLPLNSVYASIGLLVSERVMTLVEVWRSDDKK